MSRRTLKGTIESVKWMVAFWRDACHEGALAPDVERELKKIYEA